MAYNINRRQLMTSAMASAIVLPSMLTQARAQDTVSVDRNAPPPLSAYGRLPDIETVALSPDGKRIALIKDKDTERTIFDFDIKTGEVAAAVIERAKLRRLMWADNERVVFLISNHQAFNSDGYSNSDRIRGVIADLRNKKFSRMFANSFEGSLNPPQYIYDNVSRYKMGDKWGVTARSFDFDRNRPELYIFDPVMAHERAVPNAANLAEGASTQVEVQVNRWILQPDATLHARTEFSTTRKQVHISFYKDKKWWRVYTHESLTHFPAIYGLGPDGESIVVRMFSGVNDGRFCLMSPDGQIGDPIDPVPGASSPEFHPQTQRLAGFFINGTRPEYRMTDPVMAKITGSYAGAFPDYRVITADTALDPRKVIVFTEGADDAGTYTFIDFTTGDFMEVGKKYPDIPPEWIAENRAVPYQAADGLIRNGTLTLPPGREAANLPLVVLVMLKDTEEQTLAFNWIAQAIASRGYAVFQPAFAQTPNYKISFIGNGADKPVGRIPGDISDGVRHLVAQGLVDAKRVSIVGHGLGAYAALVSSALEPNTYNSAVSISGYTDIRSYMSIHENQQGLTDYWMTVFGRRDSWDAVSPTHMANRMKSPVMLIHGRKNVEVPFTQSTQMATALSAANVPNEVVALALEDHGLTNSATRLETLEAAVRFIQTHNPA